MADLINIEKDNLRAVINPRNGQLVNLSLDNLEFFYDGGRPHWGGRGWSNSEIVPYPIFGPVDNYSVRVGGQKFILDQHGISRNTATIPFFPIEKSESAVSLVQIYYGKNVPNCK